MTHTFKLPSGVECEVKEFTGKHQRIMTEQTKDTYQDKLSKLLASVLVRVGSNTNVTEDFVKTTMLTCDRNAALVNARQFSLDFEEEFVFMHTYKDAGKKIEVEISEKIPKGNFPQHPVKKLDEENKLVPANYKEYSEVVKDIFIVLPRSNKKVRFTMLDGSGEKIGMSVAKNKRSSHTHLKMRNPVYFTEGKDNKEIPVSLDLDSLSIKDIEFLRSKIKEFEGRVDTEILFEDPNTGQDKILDVVSSMAFFFPSEAI